MKTDLPPRTAPVSILFGEKYVPPANKVELLNDLKRYVDKL